MTGGEQIFFCILHILSEKNMREGLGTPAVVIGAGMAGLLAARVLHDNFSEVILLERDSQCLENGYQ